ncbi:hypothetical protein [Mucilaginibacter sp.]|uniref:hypothetical protein n=1 Tax=Mucilaginibacter sp. TaxID=1882438 RepID=UPI003AFF62AA
MERDSSNPQNSDNHSSSGNNQDKTFLSAPTASESPEFNIALRNVVRYHPADIKAPNHNDVISFIHSWFAGFDHIESAEFFLAHFDDADMTFNLDGQVLASDHQSFKNWFAEALKHIPWDYHNIIDITVTGTFKTSWTTEFFIHHVGEWHDIPLNESNTGPGRPFSRIIQANWQIEHTGEKFIIRRYELSMVQNIIPQ